MPYHLEMYVLLNMCRLHNKHCCSDEDDKMSKSKIKFLTLRSLELYERALDKAVVAELDTHKKVKLVSVCNFMVQKLYSVKFWRASHFWLYLNKMFVFEDEEAFCKEFKQIERQVWCALGGRICTPGNFEFDGDNVYHELWRFSTDANGMLFSSRPDDFDGYDCVQILENFELHMKCMEVLDAVQQIGDMRGFSGLLFSTEDKVPKELMPLYRGVLKLEAGDKIFAITIRNYYVDYEHMMDSIYFDFDNYTGKYMSPTAIYRVYREMVQGTSDLRCQELQAVIGRITKIRDDVLGSPSGFSEDKFEQIRKDVGEVAGSHKAMSQELEQLQLINYDKLETFRKMLGAVDELVEQALANLKLTAGAAKKKRARAEVEVEKQHTFTRVVLERGCRILTRVLSDAYTTPKSGLKHPVTVIQGPTKLVVKTFTQVEGDALPKLVSLDVKPSYEKVCNAAVAAYAARGVASDAARFAADAFEEEINSSAEDFANAADAANAAAEAAAQAAAAAVAAEAAATAAQRELDKEIDVELAVNRLSRTRARRA